MAKSLVIISNIITPTIAEEHRDMSFTFFRTLEELGAYIERTPIRAEELIFTRDTLPYANSSLNYLATLLNNPFMAVDHVTYVTETGSTEVESVRYLILVNKYTNWTVIEGSLTRIYLNNVILGTVEKEDSSAVRKVIYRAPRKAYIKDQLRNSEKLNQHYINDEEYLKDIPDEKIPITVPLRKEAVCERVNIVGNECSERTAFAYLAAQYLSNVGKVVILERDVEYHRLSDYVTKTKVKRKEIYLEDLYKDPAKCIYEIQTCKESLICVLAKKRIKYDYSFLSLLLYNNLMHYISYFVQELDIAQIPIDEEYLLVTPATVPEILKTCERIDPTYAYKARVIGITSPMLSEIDLINSQQLRTLVSDVLHVEIQNAVMFRLDTLVLAGSINYDLGSVLRTKHSTLDMSGFVKKGAY